jgi:hypothetical protein
VSVQAMSWVLDYSPAQRGDRLVLISLANHADRDGANAFPTVPTIARESGALSERSVQYALISLEQGYEGSGRAIERQGTAPTGATIWRVLMDDQARTFRGIPSKLRGAFSAPSEGRNSCAETAPLGVQFSTALNARERNSEPSFNRQEHPLSPAGEEGGAPPVAELPVRPDSRRRRDLDAYRAELGQWVAEHPATPELQHELEPVLQSAREAVDPGTFAIWLEPLHAHAVLPEAFVVGTDQGRESWTRDRFADLLTRLAGRDVRVIGCACAADEPVVRAVA